MDISCAWYIIPLALILDYALGDPTFLPHPIRWMGKAIDRFEPPFRLLPFGLTWSGALLAVSLIAGTWCLVVLALWIAYRIHPLLKILVEIIAIYYCISMRSLKEAAMDVLASLNDDDIEQAKDKVSMIVGRDTRRLNKNGVARAVVETVAENLVDGVISPLFFALIGGAPLALAYKMVNTLDSMVGYKNEAYLEFGKAAARIDDIANFVPARLSIVIITVAARLVRSNAWRALTTAVREGSHHTSPNAGYAEAAFAGALGVRLNGPNYYHGQLINKPFIGVKFGDVKLEHIKKACDLMTCTSILWVAAIMLLKAGIV